MPRTVALLLVVSGFLCFALLTASLWPVPAGEEVLVLGSVALPVLLSMLGAARRSGSALVLVGLTVVLVAMEAAAAGLLLLRGEPLAGPRILGLPLPAGLLLLGLGLLPLPLAAGLFAWWARRDLEIEPSRSTGGEP